MGCKGGGLEGTLEGQGFPCWSLFVEYGENFVSILQVSLPRTFTNTFLNFTRIHVKRHI